MACAQNHFITTPEKIFFCINPKPYKIELTRKSTKAEKLFEKWEEEIYQGKSNIKSLLKRYALLNQSTLAELPIIAKDYDLIVFTTGASPISINEKTEPQGKFGFDPPSVQNTFTTEWLQEYDLRNDDIFEKRAEKIMYIPVAPVLWPYTIQCEGETKLITLNKDQIELQNVLSEKNGNTKFGSLEKTLFTTISEPNYRFSETPLIWKKTSRNLDRDASFFLKNMQRIKKEKIEEYLENIHSITSLPLEDFEAIRKISQDEVQAINIAMASYYTEVIKQLGITNPGDLRVFSSKEGSAFKIISAASKKLFGTHSVNLIGGEHGPFLIKKGEAIKYDILNKSARTAFFGHIKSYFDNKEGITTSVPKKTITIPEEQLSEYKKCHYFKPILCQKQEKCDSKILSCAYSHFKDNLNLVEQKILEEDSDKYKAGIYEGIEAIISLLNNKEISVQLGNEETLLKHQIAEVRPFPIEDMEFETTLLRASGFNIDCDIAAYLNKNHETIETSTGIILPDKYLLTAHIGTAIHSLILDQYKNGNGEFEKTESNLILEKIGQEVIFRNKYCEKKILTRIKHRDEEIVITGHVDSSLVAIDYEGNTNSMILDVKRSMMPKKGNFQQATIYAQGLEQNGIIKSKRHYPVIVNRKRIPSHTQIPTNLEGVYQQPIITVRRITPFIDELIHSRNEKAYNRLKNTRAIINNKEFFIIFKQNYENHNYCDKCFESTKYLCDEIEKKALETNNKQYLADIANINTEN